MDFGFTYDMDMYLSPTKQRVPLLLLLRGHRRRLLLLLLGLHDHLPPPLLGLQRRDQRGRVGVATAGAAAAAGPLCARLHGRLRVGDVAPLARRPLDIRDRVRDPLRCHRFHVAVDLPLDLLLL